MKYLLYVFILIILDVSLVQSQESNYIYFSDIKNPEKATELTIDCYSDDFNEFVTNIKDFKNLDALHIKNYDNKYVPEEIKKLNISKLIISYSPEIDYSLLFKLLSSTNSLEILVLENNELIEVPKEISLIKSLKSLEINYNEDLDTEKLIESIKELDSLKELNLSVNSIYDLPKNIGTLKQLESLNISSNNLNDLPKEIRNLENLDTLRMEENIFTDQIKSLNRLNNVDLKFISIDNGISSENREILQKLFPNATIEESKLLFNGKFIESDTLIENFDTTESESIKYGMIKVEGVQFKALSSAYYQYARLFNNRRFDYTFDTLMFSERYFDTTYVRTSKVQSNVFYNEFIIYKRFWFLKRKIEFDIIPERRPKWLLKTENAWFFRIFPELRPYNGMRWVYKGNLSKKEFKQKYIKDKEWTDVRIYFNEENTDFTLELKSRSGFESFNTYPQINKTKYNKKSRLEDSQKKFIQLNIKYSKTLDSKKRRFHTVLARNKRYYEKAREKAIERTWRDFQNLYMCDAEKKMSKEEWLKYYDDIIKNERKALFSSTTTCDIMARSLDLEKYLLIGINQLLISNYRTYNVSFNNELNERVPVKSFIVANLNDRSYYELNGNLGIDLQSVYLLNSNIVIIAELRNGDIGYITKENFEKLNLQAGVENSINLTIIEKSLCTIGQLYELLGQ